MWRRKFKVLSILTLIAALSLLAGCEYESAIDSAQTAEGFIKAATPYVPATHTYIPLIVSTALSAAIGILKVLKAKKETQLMKDAIKAKSRQLALSMPTTDNPGKEIEHPVRTNMRKIQEVAVGKIFDDLSRFDAVRKGYIS